MAELPEAFEWGEASGNLTRPPDALISAGYLTDAAPASAHVNWLLQQLGRAARVTLRELANQLRGCARVPAESPAITHAISYQAANRIFVAHGGGGTIFSYDGMNWNACANNAPSTPGDHAFIEDNAGNLLWVMTTDIAYVADPRTGTWTSKAAGTQPTAMAFDYVNNRGVFVGGTIKFWDDITAGSPFTTATTMSGASSFRGVAYSPHDDVWVALTLDDFSTPSKKIVRSTNAGVDWSPASSEPASFRDPIDGVDLVYDTVNRCFLALGHNSTDVAVMKSVDGGDTWTDVSPMLFGDHAPTTAPRRMLELAPGLVLICAPPETGTIDHCGSAYSIDGGETWHPIAFDLETDVKSAVYGEGQVLVMGDATGGGTLWRL